MKRYRLFGVIGATSNPLGKLPCEMIETEDGEWVKWEDIKGILQDKDQPKIVDIVNQFGLKLLKDLILIDGQQLKVAVCNCEEEAHRDIPRYFRVAMLKDYWICPAHGYKKR